MVDVAGIALTDGAFAYGRSVGEAGGARRRSRRPAGGCGSGPTARTTSSSSISRSTPAARTSPASGALDLTTMRAPDPGLVVRGEGIVLAELLAAAPSSHFGFMLRVEGGGATLADLDGRLTLRVPGESSPARPWARSRSRSRRPRGGTSWPISQAAFPGLTITGEATATSTRVDGRLRVEARDLAATARSLAPPRRPPPLPLAGKGRLDLASTGPLTRPRPARGGRDSRRSASTPTELHDLPSLGDRPGSSRADPRHRRRRGAQATLGRPAAAGAGAAPRHSGAGFRRRGCTPRPPTRSPWRRPLAAAPTTAT